MKVLENVVICVIVFAQVKKKIVTLPRFFVI